MYKIVTRDGLIFVFFSPCRLRRRRPEVLVPAHVAPDLARLLPNLALFLHRCIHYSPAAPFPVHPHAHQVTPASTRPRARTPARPSRSAAPCLCSRHPALDKQPTPARFRLACCRPREWPARRMAMRGAPASGALRSRGGRRARRVASCAARRGRAVLGEFSRPLKPFLALVSIAGAPTPLSVGVGGPSEFVNSVLVPSLS